MRTASINGVELAYRDEGSGTPLLLVHAFPLGSAMWHPQISALSARYRVIAPDLRGFGESQLGDAPITLDQYADDLAGLLDHLRIAQAAVAGLSMGGYITFALLRRHPERISALILADTRSQPDTEEGRLKREENALLAEEQGPAAIAEQMLPKLLAANAPELVCDEVRRMILANDRRGIAAALRAMAVRPDSTPLLASINVPTLVIVGAEDTLTPPSDATAMAGAIPGSRLLLIPGVAHMSNLEAPEAFNAAVEDLLAPAQAWGGGGQSGGAW